jgi:hypothetical protein
MGAWQAIDRSQKLVIQEDGMCQFTAKGKRVSGRCGWDASNRGGVLTIASQTAPVTLEVDWVSDNSIRVQGKLFRRGG